MNKKTFLFDIDGTLTAPRRGMDISFSMDFLCWMSGKRVFLVTGSDKEKANEQMPASILHRCEGLFCSMANEFWKTKNKINVENGGPGELIYRNEFSPDPFLKEMLLSFQMYTKFPIKPKVGGRGVIIEDRPGMVNFTTIGRNASTEERNKYYKWDQEVGERERIAKEVEDRFPTLEVRLGGQISIDIQPKGYNKSQASQWVRENIGGKIVFVGDKCHKGGNDYDIVLDIMRNKDGEYFPVDSYEETRQLLGSLE